MDEQFEVTQQRARGAHGTVARDEGWFYATTAAGEPMGRFRTAGAARSVLALTGWEDEPRLAPRTLVRIAVLASVAMGGALTLLVTNAVMLG